MSPSTVSNEVKGTAPQVASQVKVGVQNATSATANFAGQVTDKAKEYTFKTAEKVKVYASVAKDTASEGIDTAGDYIKKFPVTIVLAAFALGYVTGSICQD
ncbi:MAG: hypothetical protein QM703_13715 [Gemmatales bacterium]